MNLVIDIGNTRIKLAIFDGSVLVLSEVLDDLRVDHIQKLKEKYPQLNKAISSTVRDYPTGAQHFLSKSFDQYIEFNHQTAVPITNRYKTPETLGLDRLAAAIGGTCLFPKQNLLIIDAGTAITYEIVTSKNEYLGGNISPGLETRFKSLHQYTGKLPLVGAKENFSKIGTDTESAIRAGVQLGLSYEIEQYIHTLRTDYENTQVILTGGDAKFFDKRLKNSIFVNFNLTLLGLNRILEYNG